jgi:hypothetical protein
MTVCRILLLNLNIINSCIIRPGSSTTLIKSNSRSRKKQQHTRSNSRLRKFLELDIYFQTPSILFLPFLRAPSPSLSSLSIRFLPARSLPQTSGSTAKYRAPALGPLPSTPPRPCSAPASGPAAAAQAVTTAGEREQDLVGEENKAERQQTAG